MIVDKINIYVLKWKFYIYFFSYPHIYPIVNIEWINKKKL